MKAMNRECARARRRRKKLRLELLENRVQELSNKNTKLQEQNDGLRTRVLLLEQELFQTKSMLSMAAAANFGTAGAGGMAAMAAASMGGMQPNMQTQQGMQNGNGGGNGGAGAGGGGGMNAELLLQRRAALAGLGGAATGLGFPAQDQNLQYMRMMEANNSKQNLGNNSNTNKGVCPPGTSGSAVVVLNGEGNGNEDGHHVNRDMF